MGQNSGQAMIEVESTFWTVSIYKQGRYSRSINATFTEVTAAIFCKSFNGVQTIFVAVAKPHTILAEVDGELSVAEECR